MTSGNGAVAPSERRELSALQLEQRRLAPLRHGLYARTEDGRRLRDHRVRYRVQKARKRFPNLGAGDVELVKAAVRLAIMADDAFGEIRDRQRRGEEVPRRLRQDAERVQLRALELEDRLRARNAANGTNDPAALLASLTEGARP